MKGFEDIKFIKVLKFAGHWNKLQEKSLQSNNPEYNLWKNDRKSSKMGHVKKFWYVILPNF